jgi:hypothetical protein
MKKQYTYQIVEKDDQFCVFCVYDINLPKLINKLMN